MKTIYTAALIILSTISSANHKWGNKSNSSSDQVELNFEFRDNWGALKDVEIVIYEGNEIIKKEICNTKTGNVTLQKNSKYIIEIKKQDYLPKIISLNTQQKDWSSSTLLEYSCIITLLLEDEVYGADVSELDFPVALLYIDDTDDKIKHRDAYLQKRVKVIESVLFEAHAFQVNLSMNK